MSLPCLASARWTSLFHFFALIFSIQPTCSALWAAWLSFRCRKRAVAEWGCFPRLVQKGSSEEKRWNWLSGTLMLYHDASSDGWDYLLQGHGLVMIGLRALDEFVVFFSSQKKRLLGGVCFMVHPFLPGSRFLASSFLSISTFVLASNFLF